MAVSAVSASRGSRAGDLGTLVERYTYTPFGERRVFLPDTEPPRIEQALAMPLEIRLEVSEEVDLAKLRDALDTGISLRSQVTGLYFDVTIDQPPTDGCKPGRRLVLRKASTNPEDPWPEPAEPVELYFAADLLTDRAGNTQPATLTKIFPWPTQPAVIQDDVAPRITTLVVEPAGTVLITFSEPPSLARLASVAKINGAAVNWTPLPEGYNVRSPRLAEGSYTLTLSTAELDLAYLGLIEPYALNFEVDGERHILKEEPPPGQVATSTAGNLIGFHGLGIDEETGLMYARNRYYDPEMGRFVSMDPLGYVDGPNGYQYGLNSPGNYSDRMGLEAEELTAYAIAKMYGGAQPEPLFANAGAIGRALENPYVGGSIQILGGCTLAVIGATATAGTAGLAAVPGIAAVGYGLDQCWTGVLTIATGEIQTTLVYKGLNAGYGTFLPPEQARAAALWTDMAIGTGLGMGVGRVASARTFPAPASQVPAVLRKPTVTASGPSPQLGQAIISRHGKNHFSIEVLLGQERHSTHQVVTHPSGLRTRIVYTNEFSAGPSQATGALDLPDARLALQRQRQLRDIVDLGKYDRVTNSCVSHVCDVLGAGGVQVPEPVGSAQLRFILEILGGKSP